LLGRLRATPDDPVAWSEFVDVYGATVLGWCHRWGLQQSDAEDVTQNVLLKLSTHMRKFEYDPARGFRAWLKTVAVHELQAYVARQRKAVQGTGRDTIAQRLETIEAREDLARSLEEVFDQELLQQAAALVRDRVEARSWEAFQLLAVQGVSGAEAANRLGMTIAAVFMSRSRIQRMIREEIAHLEQG
jgi:RNA polymerase sigma-70 factor (ECF subfamily)